MSITSLPRFLPFLLAFCIFASGLLGCTGKGSLELLPTLVPTTSLPIAEEPLSDATRIAQAPAILITSTVPIQPSPTPCQLPTQPALAVAWNIEELGCPITPGAAAVNTAYAPFEGGQMLWRGDTDMIYVLYHDGRWASYSNEWHEGDPVYSCGEEASPPTPIRGFGRVWCDYPDVGEELGAMTAAEIGDSGSVAQDFVNGTILVAPFGGLFVLVGEAGVWRRVDN